jgi:hypothetical protein
LEAWERENGSPEKGKKRRNTLNLAN